MLTFSIVRLRKILAVAILLATAIVVIGPRANAAENSSSRHVLVISVDGMGASWYRDPQPNLKIPNILRLKQEGSYAEGVLGIYPTVTYPSHTTIVTGRMPAEHGIYTNQSARDYGPNSRDWFWFAKAIKVPTLWDEAHRAGLTVAAVSWPVSVGAPIDWDLPEIWDPAKGELLDYQYLARYATPGLLQELMPALHLPQPGLDEDVIRARAASYIIKTHRPNLMLVHLNDLDHNEHEDGPHSPQARAALENIDSCIGEILAAVREAGLTDSTTVFVVSDHGFLPIERAIYPNVLLAKAGLLEVNERGYPKGGKVFTLASASFFIYWPDSENLLPQVMAALKPLFDQGLLWGSFDRKGLDDLGVEPAVKLALEPPPDALFASRAEGELVAPLKKPGGAHGFLPYRRGMEASFIAWGAGIKPGVDLHLVRMTQVGPTILKALGLEDPNFGRDPALSDVLK